MTCSAGAINTGSAQKQQSAPTAAEEEAPPQAPPKKKKAGSAKKTPPQPVAEVPVPATPPAIPRKTNSTRKRHETETVEVDNSDLYNTAEDGTVAAAATTIVEEEAAAAAAAAATDANAAAGLFIRTPIN